jgi:dihydrofolate reductase
LAKIVQFMSMSLDGLIAGPTTMREPAADQGDRLHDWLSDGGVDPRSHRPASAPSATVFDEVMATGAVIAGQRTYELAGGWNGDHHDGVPVFVVTHSAPDGTPPGSVRFITECIESCVGQAKAAAGDKDVLVHGANTAQECLLDEMEIQLIPVLLGEGRRLFEGLGREHIELELVRALEAPGVTRLRHRVQPAATTSGTEG